MLQDRQPEGSLAASLQPCFHAQRATLPEKHLACESQPLACAGMTIGIFPAKAVIKNMWQLVRRNAWSVVDDFEYQYLAFHASGQYHLAPRGAVLDCIVRQGAQGESGQGRITPACIGQLGSVDTD